MKSAYADALPSGLLIVDAAGCIVGANALVEQWSGIRASELVGLPFDSFLRQPTSSGTAVVEYLPAVAEIYLLDGSVFPVLVAEGELGEDGRRYLTLFDARAQRAFRERLQAQHSLIERTQTRLELVIGASIAFAEAPDEFQLAEVLASTTTRAYAAEEAAVFLLDDQMAFHQVAGASPLVDIADADELAARAIQLRTVLTISGIDAARAIAPAVGAAFEAAGVQSMIVAPIHQGDSPLGVLVAFFHHPREFDEQASPLADALAAQAARAMTALRLQHRLELAAMHDDVTGLPNRRSLEEATDMSPRIEHPLVAVLFVDLDRFKTVNDRLGHHVGDELLRIVGQRLRDTIRATDVAARYGGDEFVVVCRVADESDATEMAERIRETISAPYSILPDGLTIGASIGVSMRAADLIPASVDALVRAADQAMYRAKYAGGNRIVVGPS